MEAIEIGAQTLSAFQGDRRLLLDAHLDPSCDEMLRRAAQYQVPTPA
jgi:hypothetical protein